MTPESSHSLRRPGFGASEDASSMFAMLEMLSAAASLKDAHEELATHSTAVKPYLVTVNNSKDVAASREELARWKLKKEKQ